MNSERMLTAESIAKDAQAVREKLAAAADAGEPRWKIVLLERRWVAREMALSCVWEDAIRASEDE